MPWRLPLVVLALLLPAEPAGAWGFEAHRFIAGRAIELLPAPIRPFFEKHRTYLVEHSIDPDLWRMAGFDEEPPQHYLDLDAYGSYPFAALPRDYDAAVRKFGRKKIHDNGLVPWRTAEMFDRLVRAFERLGKGASPFALEEIKFFSSAIVHYVSDAHVPLHAVLNYDGQLSGQRGVHGRFEAELYERYRDRLTIAPRARPAVAAPRDFVFDTLLAGFQLVEGILDADRRAATGRETYDDRFFDTFFASVRPVLERRLDESIAGVAAVIAGAWERAGRPALPAAGAPPTAPRKVKPLAP